PLLLLEIEGPGLLLSLHAAVQQGDPGVSIIHQPVAAIGPGPAGIAAFMRALGDPLPGCFADIEGPGVGVAAATAPAIRCAGTGPMLEIQAQVVVVACVVAALADWLPSVLFLAFDPGHDFLPGVAAHMIQPDVVAIARRA